MNKRINIKLADANYLQWKHQVVFMIASHQMKGYLDGSTRVDEWIFNSEDMKINNPNFANFKHQDSVLASWILSLIS